MREAVTFVAVVFVILSTIALWEYWKRGEKKGKEAAAAVFLITWAVVGLLAVAWLVSLPFR